VVEEVKNISIGSLPDPEEVVRGSAKFLEGLRNECGDIAIE